jgi:hypothetical protein
MMLSSYEFANEKYAAGFYEKAAEKYSEAITYSDGEKSHSDLYLRCLSNRAQCFIMQRFYDKAACDCTTIITMMPSDENVLVKAFIRRANCHRYLGNYEHGISDLNRALTFRLSPALLKTTLAALSSIKLMAAKDELVLKSEGRPPKLVTSSQALRLGFMNTIKRDVIFGEPIAIKLCIGNELGLWDRDIRMKGAGDSNAPYVTCELLEVFQQHSAQRCHIAHRFIPHQVWIPLNGKVRFSLFHRNNLFVMLFGFHL